MQRSEQFGELVTALLKSQSQFKPVPKNKTAKVKTKTSGEYTYKYADLADVLSMAIPILSANQIAFMQPHVLVEGKLRVVTMLVHSSGQWMQSDGIEISEDGEPQQFGAESTYFRRYDGCSLLGIAPDEDTDAQQADTRTRKAVAPSPAPSIAAAPAKLTDAVLASTVKTLESATTLDQLSSAYKEAYRIAQQANDSEAITLFTAAKDGRKKVIGASN